MKQKLLKQAINNIYRRKKRKHSEIIDLYQDGKQVCSVFINEIPLCTCTHFYRHFTCVHKLHILLFHYKLNINHPYLWYQFLSKKQLRQIITKKTDVKKIIKSKKICSICMNNINPTSTNVDNCLSCKNIFHFDCMSQWINTRLDLNQNPTCPLCRSQL